MGDQLQIVALVFHNGGTYIEAETAMGEFWIQLSPLVGWGRFCVVSMTNGLGTFELREVRPAHAVAPCPVVSLSSVLWRRQAAIEAHQSISSYRQAVDQLPQSFAAGAASAASFFSKVYS